MPDLDLNDDMAVCHDLLHREGECPASTPDHALAIILALPAEHRSSYGYKKNYETMLYDVYELPNAENPL